MPLRPSAGRHGLHVREDVVFSGEPPDGPRLVLGESVQDEGGSESDGVFLAESEVHEVLERCLDVSVGAFFSCHEVLGLLPHGIEFQQDGGAVAVEEPGELLGHVLPVGDDDRDHVECVDGGDEVFELGVDGGFSAADDDDGAGAEVFGLVDDVEDFLVRHLVWQWLSAFSVAVFTAEVACQAGLEADGEESVMVPRLPGLLIGIEVPFEHGRSAILLPLGHRKSMGKEGMLLDIICHIVKSINFVKNTRFFLEC